jgi:subfamily B ATP-binding cassette protein MsbA
VRHSERTPRSRVPAAVAPDPATPPKKAFTPGAWEEARGIIWTHRKRLALGLGLMLINRLSGFVLPTTTKYLMDDVLPRTLELLPTLAMAAGAATVVDAATVREPRCWRGGAARQPRCARTSKRTSCASIRYFDSTKTGVLISRIMNDADGIGISSARAGAADRLGADGRHRDVCCSISTGA